MTSTENPFTGTDHVRLSSDEKAAAAKELLSFMQKNPAGSKRPKAETPEVPAACLQFFQACQGLGLQPEEKKEILSSIRSSIAVADFDPMDASVLPAGILGFSLLRLFPSLAFALLLLTATGGVVAYAAESSLPGDFLYPFKVNVTEEIRARFAQDLAARAEWESERAERRLLEAEELARLSGLNQRIEHEIKRSFDRHAEAAQSHISVLESRKDPVAERLKIDFKSRLDAHVKILEGIGGDDAEKNKKEYPLLNRIDTLRQDVMLRALGSSSAAQSSVRSGDSSIFSSAPSSTRSSTSVTDIASIEADIEAATTSIAAVRSSLSARQNRLLPSAIAQVNEQLSLSEAALAAAKIHVGTQQYDAARTQVSRALALAKDAKGLLSTLVEVIEGKETASSTASAASSVSVPFLPDLPDLSTKGSHNDLGIRDDDSIFTDKDGI